MAGRWDGGWWAAGPRPVGWTAVAGVAGVAAGVVAAVVALSWPGGAVPLVGPGAAPVRVAAATSDSAGPGGTGSGVAGSGVADPPGPAGARTAPDAGYGWPLRPTPIVGTPFRAPELPYGPGHRGVDLVGSAGQPVVAARAGTVVFAGVVAGRGVVSIDHGDGLRTTYEPVRAMVRAGAAVAAGAVLGLLEPGHGGCPAAACLHWGVRRDRTEYLDPLVLLRPPRVRLLPVPIPAR